MEYLTNNPDRINQIILEKLECILKSVLEREKPFLTINEAAQYLGISKNSLYLYTSQKAIPYFKPRNRKIYFAISDLDKFALDRRNRISSDEEIETKVATRLSVKRIK
jgi:excisionase family DNA binding protein